jgi:DNA-binding LacI/PurR family transcriptional regulator
MSRRPVTIRDVAARAGVSESTVSRVLGDVETAITISDETRERVQRAARELQYRPHPYARALRGKGVNLLGVIAREIDDPFFAELIEAINNIAREAGYNLALGYAGSDPDQALALTEMLDIRQSDGLLLLGDLRESPEDRSFLVRMAADRRVVSVCRGSDQLVEGTPSVGVDNRSGVFAALEYLVGLGHRRIAHITVRRFGDFFEREQAYRDFISERVGELPVGYVQHEENSYEGGYRATRVLLGLPQRPSAILVADDTMAIGALGAAHDAGIRVPSDLSVVGFDDIKIAAHVRPALTTVRQPIGEIGRRAVELLIELIEARAAPEPLPRIVLAPELVVRASCAPPPE